MRRIAILIPMFAVLALAGCAAPRMVARGDESLRAGRPQAAVRHYEEAARRRPRLLEDPDFVSKLNQARALRAYEEGRRTEIRGQWETAMARYREALEYDPLLDRARRALQNAQIEASRMRHRQAIKLADAGRLNEAVSQLEQAVELDPDNEGAHDALDSVERAKREARTRTDAAYQEAQGLMADGRWDEAHSTLERVIGEEPNHLPARVDRHRASRTIEDARDKAGQAEELLDAKKLDQARATMIDVLNVWPTFARARNILERAEAGLAEAERLFERAVELGERGQWDEAVRAASQSLDRFPYTDERREFLRLARQRAAEAHTRAGDRLLAEGELGEAETRYHRALGFVPAHGPAKAGLGQADYLRGKGAEEQGLWGHALLWYRRAVGHSSQEQFAAALREARRTIFERAALTVNASVNDRTGVGSPFESFRADVLARLSRARPDIAHLVGDDDADYRITIALDVLDVRTELVRREHRVHTYTEYHRVPNPRIPQLESRLRSARRELVRLERAYQVACRHCGGSGRVVQQQPATPTRPDRRESSTDRREQEKPQLRREAERDDRTRGDRSRDGDRGRTDRSGRDRRPDRDEDRGRRPPSYVACPRCSGTGRAGTITRTDIRRQALRVNQIERTLRAEPTMVRRASIAEWPYIVEHYRKTGIIQVAVRIEDAAGRTVSRSVSDSATFSDQTIDNANAAVGLDPNPLALPDAQQIMAELIEDAAPKAAAAAMQAVLSDRADRLEQEARRLEAAGKPQLALEYRVDRARVIETFDRGGAGRLLDTLGRSLPSDPVPVRPAPELVPRPDTQEPADEAVPAVPDDAGDPEPDIPGLGLHVQPLTDRLAEQFGAAGRAGMLVSGVEAGSKAERAGIRAGDIILRFNGRPLPDVETLERLAAEADYPVPIVVLRDGEELERTVR